MIRLTRNIPKEEIELLNAKKALKAAEEQRKNIEKYAKLQKLAEEAAKLAESEAIAAEKRAAIAAYNNKKELECLWVDNKKKTLYIKTKEKLIEFVQILDEGKFQNNARIIENEIRNLKPEILENLAKKSYKLKDDFQPKRKHQRTRKKREKNQKQLEKLLEDTSTFSFMIFFLSSISFVMSNKLKLSNYTIVHCLMGLYGEWRGFREFAVECADEDKTNKIYEESSVSEIDEKWNQKKPKLTEIFCKKKSCDKPKLTEIFCKKKEPSKKIQKTKEFPSLYEAYRGQLPLKSALKKTSSFGQSKILFEKVDEKKTTSFGQNNWIIEKTNNY